MLADRFRAAREAAGLTQSELAARAGVSRQLVGALEAGRHLPRVDAALRLAGVLGENPARLFGHRPAPLDVATGTTPADGTAVRVGEVGDLVVTAPAEVGAIGWGIADGVVDDGDVMGPPGRPGAVLIGCEPGLAVLEQLQRESGRRAVSVAASSAVARVALEAGRAHAAVVHGPDGEPLPGAPAGALRLHLARWRVGLAASPDLGGDWWRRALSGDLAVVQREPGAAVQAELAAAAGRDLPGPTARGHVAAVAMALASGRAALTIEPAAIAAGAAFHPLGLHRA
ncbi:MAG: helix-turn-helix transcriptional regulator, partial [Acidimicrobiia bacterium]